MTISILGCGTDQFGMYDWQGESYVTTEWISLLGIPAIPLRSYRVLFTGDDPTPGFFLKSRNYRILGKEPLNAKRIAAMYLMSFAYAAYFLLMYIYGIDLSKGIPYGTLIWVVLLAAPILLTHEYQMHQKRQAYKRLERRT